MWSHFISSWCRTCSFVRVTTEECLALVWELSWTNQSHQSAKWVWESKFQCGPLSLTSLERRILGPPYHGTMECWLACATTPCTIDHACLQVTSNSCANSQRLRHLCGMIGGSSFRRELEVAERLEHYYTALSFIFTGLPLLRIAMPYPRHQCLPSIARTGWSLLSDFK